MTEAHQLQARIKELESEKDNAYQEGKLSVVNRLLDLNPENAIDALNELTITTRMGEEYEESWDSKKLLEYFDVDQSFQSKITELEDRCEAMYWSAIAIREGLSDDIFFEGDKNLRQFMQSRINEIKAQGIEEFMRNMDLKYLFPPHGDIGDYFGSDAVSTYLKKLRSNHD